MKTAWFTICAKNYLAYAITLYQSLVQHHEDAQFTVFLVDELDDQNLLKKLPFTLINAKSLPLAHFPDMALRYDVMELATAIKPTCFKTLLTDHNFDSAIYLDPDLFITAPLAKVQDGLKKGHDLILTPHILTPYQDDKHPDHIQILNAGTYNLGFAALSNKPSSINLLNWWQNKLFTKGHNDITNGYFVDQKYMELAPCFVPKTHILQDRGYNAAYWNLHERPVTRKNQQWYAGDDKLAFFHFSGVIPNDETIFSKHQNRFSVNTIGPLKELLNQYLQKLNINHYKDFSSLPYSYDQFSDKTPISPMMRRHYADCQKTPSPTLNLMDKLDPALFNHPSKEYPLPALLVRGWKSRPDLQKAFSLGSHQGRVGFLNWVRANAEQQFSLPPSLLDELLSGTTPNNPAHQTARSKMAALATKTLAAAPSLRPLYQHLPTGLRSKVKTLLLRTHASGGDHDQLKIGRATGDFDSNRAKGVHLYGYVRSQSGIGQGARGLVSALKTTNIPLAVTALANLNDQRETHPFPEISPPTNGMRIALIDANAEQTRKMEELINPQKLRGCYRIGYWVWELSKFPQIWEPATQIIDEFWVPSQFVATALRSITNKPIHIIPHVIKPETPAALGRSHFKLPPERTIFLTSFDVNSFMKRKNPDATISAFREAFDEASPNSPILAIKIHGGEGKVEITQTLQRHIGNISNIVLIDQTLKRDEYLALQHLCDVFISLHRSEGFGLNIAETMHIGKAVIATDYSGNCDFLDESNGIPIPYELVNVPNGAYPHSTGQKWAEPDHQAAILAMQKLAYDQGLRDRLGQQAKDTIIRSFSEQSVSKIIKKRISEIDQELTR